MRVDARTALALALISAPVPALAEETKPIALTVGATTRIEVGWAMGHLCDDTTIVSAAMLNQDADTNVLVVKGLKAGVTLCRAGTYAIDDRPTYLYEITVVAPAAAVTPRPTRPIKRRP